MLWKEDYALGVELIDRQHRELFTVINRILQILQNDDFDRNQRTCIEAIKYLKNYALEHFSAEEAYQLEIGYAGYPHHKRQHEAFVGTIGELERDLAERRFSRDAVRRFTGVLTSWLVYHIMDSDQAIVRGGHEVHRGEAAQVVEGIVLSAARDMFSIELRVDNGNYTGALSGGEILCLTRCATPDGARRLHVLFAADESVALSLTNTMLDLRLDAADELVLSALKELSTLLSVGFADTLLDGAGCRMEASEILPSPAALPEELGAPPAISILFGSPAGSCLARVWQTP